MNIDAIVIPIRGRLFIYQSTMIQTRQAGVSNNKGLNNVFCATFYIFFWIFNARRGHRRVGMDIKVIETFCFWCTPRRAFLKESVQSRRSGFLSNVTKVVLI